MRYRKAYYLLFSAIADALDVLDTAGEKAIKISGVRTILQNAQLQAEDLIMEGEPCAAGHGLGREGPPFFV